MSRKEKRDSISRHLEDVSLSIHIYMYPLYPRAPPQDDISRGTIHPFLVVWNRVLERRSIIIDHESTTN